MERRLRSRYQIACAVHAELRVWTHRVTLAWHPDARTVVLALAAAAPRVVRLVEVWPLAGLPLRPELVGMRVRRAGCPPLGDILTEFRVALLVGMLHAGATLAEAGVEINCTNGSAVRRFLAGANAAHAPSCRLSLADWLAKRTARALAVDADAWTTLDLLSPTSSTEAA